YGIGVPKVGPADTAGDALAAAARIGYPVVLKTGEPGIAHKSDAGGGVLGVGDPAGLTAAYAGMAARLGPRGLVCEAARPGPRLRPRHPPRPRPRAAGGVRARRPAGRVPGRPGRGAPAVRPGTGAGHARPSARGPAAGGGTRAAVRRYPRRGRRDRRGLDDR